MATPVLIGLPRRLAFCLLLGRWWILVSSRLAPWSLSGSGLRLSFCTSSSLYGISLNHDCSAYHCSSHIIIMRVLDSYLTGQEGREGHDTFLLTRALEP